MNLLKAAGTRGDEGLSRPTVAAFPGAGGKSGAVRLGVCAPGFSSTLR
jgi:hypothetical protein